MKRTKTEIAVIVFTSLAIVAWFFIVVCVIRRFI